MTVPSDRCYHIPTAPGQSMCTCEDNRMWLELTVEMLCRRVVALEARLQRQKPRVLIDEPHTHGAETLDEVSPQTQRRYGLYDMTVPKQVPSKRPDPVGPTEAENLAPNSEWRYDNWDYPD